MGFAVPRRSGGYVAGVGRSIVAVDWSTQMMTPLAEVDEDKPNNRLNDGKVDPVGRLVAGKRRTRLPVSNLCCRGNAVICVQVRWERRSNLRRFRGNKDPCSQ